jgi:hypothetical protein
MKAALRDVEIAKRSGREFLTMHGVAVWRARPRRAGGYLSTGEAPGAGEMIL